MAGFSGVLANTPMSARFTDYEPVRQGIARASASVHVGSADRTVRTLRMDRLIRDLVHGSTASWHPEPIDARGGSQG